MILLMPSSKEFAVAQELTEILKTFYFATQVVSGENYLTNGIAHPPRWKSTHISTHFRLNARFYARITCLWHVIVCALCTISLRVHVKNTA